MIEETNGQPARMERKQLGAAYITPPNVEGQLTCGITDIPQSHRVFSPSPLEAVTSP